MIVKGSVLCHMDTTLGEEMAAASSSNREIEPAGRFQWHSIVGSSDVTIVALKGSRSIGMG